MVPTNSLISMEFEYDPNPNDNAKCSIWHQAGAELIQDMPMPAVMPTNSPS